MKETASIRRIYSEIQDKLFKMIPEEFHSVYLYCSIIEQIEGKPIGEMYFYYFPKGILKRKPVNVYEIPDKFNIDDEKYSKLINDLYQSFLELRLQFTLSNQEVWTNLTMKIENLKFTVEYDYEDITLSEYSNYERHIIWRYKYIQSDINTYGKKEKELLIKYLNKQNQDEDSVDSHTQRIYMKKSKNIFNYEIENITEEENEETKETSKN